MQAVIYARWSSLEQSHGSSLARQIEQCQKFCEAQGWPVIDQLRDEGRSAYTGDNIKDGELARFIRRLENGLVPRDTVLVVEQLDRISRLPPPQVFSWIQRVTGLGLTIATQNDRTIIDADSINAEPVQFIGMVFNSFRAYQESKHKSERLSESWRLRRKSVSMGERPAITSVCPAWLRLDKDTGKFVEVPERVEVVRRIFEDARAGIGLRKIAERLNTENVPTWGSGKRASDGWYPSYVNKILSNIAVLGDFQPHTKRRGGPRTPVGDVVRGYYPKVIDEFTFAEVNGPRRNLPGSARKGRLANLFSGLAKCGACGGSMVFVNKQKAGTKRKDRGYIAPVDQSYLVCSRARRGRECTNLQHFNYPKLEKGILDETLALVLGNEHFEQPNEVGRIQQLLAAAKRDKEHRANGAARMLRLFRDTGEEDARESWLEAKADLKKLDDQVQALEEELLKAQGAVSQNEHIKRLAAFRDAIHDDDEEARFMARSRMMQAMAQTIHFIKFDPNRVTTVIFIGGAHAVRFADDGSVLDSAGVLDQLRKGSNQYKLKDGTVVRADVETLKAGLAGDDAYALHQLDKLAERSKDASSRKKP